MAKKTKKERDTEILEYRIAKREELLFNWDKYGISQLKIDKLTAKKIKDDADLIIVQNS